MTTPTTPTKKTTHAYSASAVKDKEGAISFILEKDKTPVVCPVQQPTFTQPKILGEAPSIIPQLCSTRCSRAQICKVEVPDGTSYYVYEMSCQGIEKNFRLPDPEETKESIIF